MGCQCCGTEETEPTKLAGEKAPVYISVSTAERITQN